jgi:UDP-GlcNAc3NAcA epimerase
MIKLLNVIGARPQIIKASAISRAIRRSFLDQIEEIVLHTGQHYDENMSDVFLQQLGLTNPAYNLNVGSESHGQQTAKMLLGIEDVILKEKPEIVLVYGDTNSTLAAAIASSKLQVPLAHIEAGLRSFNKSMPEEINRIMCDHCSTLLFSPTVTGINNLRAEGFNIENKPSFNIDNPGIFHCGDIMYDNSIYFSQFSKNESNILEELELKENDFILTTIHRPSNTDNINVLCDILDSLIDISVKENQQIIFPIHPRTKGILKDNELLDKYSLKDKVLFIPPVSFFDIIELEKNSSFIITDSGGIQKEAYFFNKKSIVLRKETEWVELIDQRASVLAGNKYDEILDALNSMKNLKPIYEPVFGNGNASDFICNSIIETIIGS